MRIILLIALVCVTSSHAFEEVLSVFDYHEKIGIPSATKIKVTEDEIFGTDGEGNRIVGGAVAVQASHPYLAGLVINFLNIAGQSACGSSLLSANRLVTAAHCWFDGRNQAWQFTVVLGSQYLFYGGTRIATTTVVMHPQWTPSTLGNDVAVIYLPTNVMLTANIQPIALPSTTQLFDTFVGEWAQASGYGRTSDQQAGVTTASTISQVFLQVITVAQCQATFGSTFVQSSTLCTSGAGGVGICGGDSGGPLVINRNGQNILVGVSSFVAAAGCQLGHPSAFARVTSFYNFIVQNLY